MGRRHLCILFGFLVLLAAGCSHPPSGPEALIRVSKWEGGVPLEVEFDGSLSWAPDSSIVWHTWDFGDGLSLPKEEPVEWTVMHTFEEPGEFLVTLTICDAAGSVDSSQVCIKALNLRPQAVITASAHEGTCPLEIHFDGSQSLDPESDPLAYHWDFGDGATTSGVSCQHVYTYPGTYRVQLIVRDNYGNESWTMVFIRAHWEICYDTFSL